MTTLNLNTKAIETVSHLFGVPFSQLNDKILLDGAKELQQQIVSLKVSNEGLESTKILKDIEALEEAKQAFIVVYDGGFKLAEKGVYLEQPAFDMSKPKLEEKDIVFGVYADQLTEESLITAITRLKTHQAQTEEVNKDLDSEKLAKKVKDIQESIKLLKTYLDSLPESK